MNAEDRPDIALLDARMNGNDRAGFLVSSALLNKWPGLPIIFLSEHSGTGIEKDALTEHQVTDFIAKHQRNVEDVLCWHMRAVLRHQAVNNDVAHLTDGDVLRSGELRLDLYTWEVYWKGVRLMNPDNPQRPLAPTPRKILRCLVERSPRPVTTDQIAEYLGVNPDRYSSATYRQHIKTLRRVIDAADGGAGEFIEHCKNGSGIVSCGEQGALNSMLYLWDLLDLSTTDNIAMYVANKLYECEELYYRKVLDEDKDETPFTPLFPARAAAVRAVRGFVEEAGHLSTERLVEGEAFCYEDDRFLVYFEDAGDLLGNENYILLIVENMINNGLYYASQKQYRNRYAKLSLRVEKDDGNAVFRIYNPGPGISDDVRDKIYQLGYSTKRSKDHHGKGLGLYFVKQLVNGYEGSIDFCNVCNREDTYVVRIECESGILINQIIETAVNDKGKPVCMDENGATAKELRFSVPERIRSLEVSRQAGKQTHVFVDFESSGKTTVLDPAHRDRPAWRMDVAERVSSTEIVFKPLDTMGVEFTIRIPTAESRLDPEYHDSAQQSLTELDTLNENFRSASKLIED